MRKNIFLTVLVFYTITGLQAQAPSLQAVKDELYKVNKVFDSSRYLAFNVHIKYYSDTVYGKYEYEDMKGNYIINNKHLYYHMGNTEYVQNDSFSYSLYHDDPMLIMSRDIMPANSSMFPLKEFLDSTLTYYGAYYSISLRDEDDSKVIEFTATDSNVLYKRFAIFYEQESYYPDRFELYFIDEVAAEPSSVSDPEPAKRFISVYFSNYSQPNNLDVFNDTNYVYYDRGRKQYSPSEKYRNYKFMTNGMEDEGDADTIEMYPPPGGN